jgi:hypothetical protein
LRLEESHHLLEAARGDRLEALYVLALNTSMRQGELVALKWDDVEEQGFSEVRCYSIISRMPNLIRFNSCAPTSPTIISGEVGSADDRVLPTQS